MAGTTLSSRDSWRRLEERLEARLGNAEAERHPPAVLVIDLDRFQAVNDCLGHSLGGELLESVANRLGDAVGDQGALAYLGGDEFAVMIDRCSGTGHARSVARAIQSALRAPFELDGQEVYVSVSIGIATSDPGSGHQTPEEYLRRADTAMYHAKSTGRGNCAMFTRAMRTHRDSEYLLEQELRRAVARREFEVHYQPIVNLGDGAIEGFEALVRWRHPERGLVYPDTFIPMAEQTGLILPIGWMVLEEACRELSSWRAESNGRPFVSVNFSGLQFKQADMVDRVESVLENTGCQAADLRLELTETMVMEPSGVAVDTLRRLSDLDVQLYLDDFGTGYSSLSHLHRLPTHAIKIDRSFVNQVTKNPEIVRAILALAGSLDMRVEAEGIETSLQLACLTARGESRSYEGSTQSIRRTTLTRMAMGTRETDQPPLWIATSDLPTSPGHPFYARLTTLLDGHHFDRFVEGLCDRFYAPVMGRPSLAPGRYFRLLLVGYFEGIDSERGIAWRATDSLAVRSFLRLAVDEAPPDHSTIARTRRLIDLETHRTVFTWVQQRLVEAGRLTGKTIAIDATTLEANAAMRSIVRRDTGESYQAFLAGLATASGVETPTREGLARLDRKRKKKTSNTDWTHPHDPDAKVTKMKDGRTHLAHKAEHAVDMETGAIVAVTLQGADVGDTTTIIETAIAATEQVEDAQANVDDRQSLDEIVGDKGYHSNQTLIDLDAVGIRSYVSEPDRGRRDWSKDPAARAPLYGNRRRMRGRRGRRLMRQRGERIERSFAHLYDTGGMRRTHLRGHTNILKRLLIHAGGFNLGLVMRHLIGIGTPRGLQGRVAAVLATLGVLMGVVRRRLTTISSSHRLIPAVRGRLASLATFAVNSSAASTCTTGC